MKARVANDTLFLSPKTSNDVGRADLFLVFCCADVCNVELMPLFSCRCLLHRPVFLWTRRSKVVPHCVPGSLPSVAHEFIWCTVVIMHHCLIYRSIFSFSFTLTILLSFVFHQHHRIQSPHRHGGVQWSAARWVMAGAGTLRTAHHQPSRARFSFFCEGSWLEGAGHLPATMLSRFFFCRPDRRSASAAASSRWR